MKVDLMVFGAHPDDIEIGISGTVAKYTSKNKNVILVDLTIGEMGTNGNTEIRKTESQNAAKILNVSERLNLYMEDRFIELSKKNISKIVEIIRKYRPDVIMYLWSRLSSRS